MQLIWPCVTNWVSGDGPARAIDFDLNVDTNNSFVTIDVDTLQPPAPGRYIADAALLTVALDPVAAQNVVSSMALAQVFSKFTTVSFKLSALHQEGQMKELYLMRTKIFNRP